MFFSFVANAITDPILERFMRVLIFLHRSDLRKRVAGALSSTQFVVDSVASAKECLQSAQLTRHEGVLVDSEFFVFEDVLALIRLLREENSTQALFVLARYLDLEQRLQLFEAGVDDCMSEPFFASELAVRLGHSIRLRQAASALVQSNTVNVLRSGDLELDLVRRKTTRLGKPISLTPKEFLLLEYLMRNADRPLTRSMILEHVWNTSFEGMPNVVDVCISSLRSKIDHGFPQKLIQTNRGFGYTFTSATALPLEANGRAGRNNRAHARTKCIPTTP
jgi:DNA-binding response OmpR family regulator